MTTLRFQRTWGSILDLKKLFARLKIVQRNALDDGTVVGHRNLDEVGLSAIEPPRDVGTED